jgi:hypothetical protein
MRRALACAAVTLGAIATACGLVIDPDRLVSDVGADAGTAVGSVDGGDRTDAAPDAEPPANVPACVPKPPSDTNGPYAVVSSSAPQSLACPAGYLATPLAKGKGGAQTKSATCGDSSGCSCGGATGTPACALRVRYYDDFKCNDEVGTPDLVTPTCTELPGTPSYLRVESAVTGMTCPPSGQATPTSKQPVTFASESWVCEPDPATSLGSCGAGEVALPPTENASACVILKSGDTCPSPYTRTRDLSKDGAVIDDRACACTCAVEASGACSGGSATTYFDNGCQNAPQSLPLGSCRIIAATDGIKGTPGTLGGTPTCIPKAMPTGSARPATDLKLCCLR